jgi:tetratricopeptide (TPR) repeat protein
MPLIIRVAVAGALCAIVAACTSAETLTGSDLPENVTVRDSRTGETRTMSGATAMVALARIELSRRNHAGAMRAATSAIALNELAGSELSMAHALRGDAYYMAGDAAKARDEWRTAVEIDGQNPTALRGMALIANMQRRFSQSMQYLQRAIAVAPENASLYITRGLLRLQEGRAVGAALADFDKAVSLRPNQASAYFYRGLANHISGRYAQAKADYDRALDINPGERRASQALGLLEQRRAPATLQPRTRSNDVVEF